MKAPRIFISAVLATLSASCSNLDSTAYRTEPAPEIEQRSRDFVKLDAKRRDFQLVLIRLDQAMESYTTALANRGDPRADTRVQKLGNLLQSMVLDNNSGQSEYMPNSSTSSRAPGENFRRLKAQAADSSSPDKQAIALAALGFSGRRDVMALIAQGAMQNDAFVVDHAVLGLAILRSPTTPPGVLASIIENQNHPEDGRIQAAWALYQVQTATSDTTEIVKVWERLLTSDQTFLPDGVIVTAIRGLGLAGDKAHAATVVPMLMHPTPRVRMASAIALGRMNAQEYWRELLALLGPQESVQNVRLHARKALARLAGNTDYGYDESAWKKTFDRGDQQK